MEAFNYKGRFCGFEYFSDYNRVSGRKAPLNIRFLRVVARATSTTLPSGITAGATFTSWIRFCPNKIH